MVRALIVIVGIVLMVTSYTIWQSRSSEVLPIPEKQHPIKPVRAVKRHVQDIAGVLPSQDLPRFEQYMEWIVRESDVDVRFVFVRGTGEKSLEQLAVDLVDEMRIGGTTREQRGLLLLYDMQGQRLKVEVGYGLEAYFPDAFVSYLVNDHARMFFESGNVSVGLRLMLRLLQHRIREAVIGNDFDPRVLKMIENRGYLSGGAGVSTEMPIGSAPRNPAPSGADTREPGPFDAQNTPEQTYRTYLAWLSQRKLDPNADLFTRESRSYLSGLQVSPAYADFIFFTEYGKRFQLIERNDRAILFFTGTPFASPHFFVRQDGKWRMDMVAEVRNTHEHTGGVLTWGYYGEGDPYTQAFSDLLINVHGYRRFRDGDNRTLPIRGSS